MTKILRCTGCARYTLRKRCNICGAIAYPAKPPKYSPEDKWGEYRRRAKEQQSETL